MWVSAAITGLFQTTDTTLAVPNYPGAPSTSISEGTAQNDDDHLYLAFDAWPCYSDMNSFYDVKYILLLACTIVMASKLLKEDRRDHVYRLQYTGQINHCNNELERITVTVLSLQQAYRSNHSSTPLYFLLSSPDFSLLRVESNLFILYEKVLR
jgi:hypothetical protein